MKNRRIFIKDTLALATGCMVLPLITSSLLMRKTIGLQLYTMRDQIKQDLDGTLKRLTEIGYNSIEAAGYNLTDRTFYGISPKAFSKKLKGLGMPLNSSHTVFEPDAAEQVFADAAEAGCKYVIYPYLSEGLRENIDRYKAIAEKFNHMGEIGKKNGIRFGYHNHSFEFVEMNGQIGMDVLIAETDPELVTFELDLYWITHAGYDPVDYIEKFPGRFEIYHVKDMTNTEDKYFAPVGTGRINFERIFASKETAGMKMFFVEQDYFRDYDPFESVKISYDFLNNASFI